MSRFDAFDMRLAGAQFDHFGDDGVYDGAIECQVIVDTDTVWLETEESRSARTETTLVFWLAEVNPVRGKTVVVAGKSYKLGQRAETTATTARHLVAK